MKKIFTFFAFILIGLMGFGQIISQYIETNSGTYPKGIEIWNNTGATLDFSTNSLVIEKGSNGGTPSTDFTLSNGTLVAGAVIVIGTSDLETVTVANGSVFHEKAFTFNGDDALQVKYGGTITDIFGDPGDDPGSSWTGNSVSTANQNIELNLGITTGASSNWTDPSLRFNTISTNPSGTSGDDGFGIAPSSGSTPTIITSAATLTGFSYSVGSGPSAEQSFTVEGSNLTADISIVPPTDYEISTGTSGSFSAANPITLAQSGGSVAQTTIYVRLKSGLAEANYDNENIVSTSTGATTENVSCSGSIFTPPTTTIPYNQEFTSDLGDCDTYSVSGSSKVWSYSSGVAQMNGYNSGDTEEDWLIIPGIDFDSYTNEEMTFKTEYQYGTDDVDNYLKLMYSSDYSGAGDPTSSTWTELTHIQPSSGNSQTSSGIIDLSALSGSNVYIAFKYRYEAGSYRRWNIDDIDISINGGNSNESVISTDATFSYPANIYYHNFTTASGLSSASSIEVAKFTLKDGDGSTNDADALGTILTDLSIDISNYEGIQAIALFDGTTNLSEVTTSASTVDFTGLSLTAADDATKDFSIRVTFSTSQTDNQQMQYTISDATANAAGSDFATFNAGSATTNISGDNNKIEVVATKLNFTTDNPPTTVDNATNFNVEVEALDVNNNRDLDAINAITLIKASGTGVLSSATGLVQSLVSGVYSWTDVQYNTDEDFTIEAQAASLTNKTTGAITCSTPPAIPDLIISEVADPKDTPDARFVELYNGSGSTIDFSTVTFYISRQANGGNWADAQLSGTLAAGATFIISYKDASTFNGYYGVNSNQQAGSVVTGNGDDGYFLYYDGDHSSGTLIDQFGVIDEDGSGKDWEYEDSRVVRTTSAQPAKGKDAHTFDISQWSITADANVADMTPGTKEESQILPIHLISFSAKASTNSVNLNWQTASEIDNDYFTIERSYNAMDFEEIAQLKAAGNSNKTISYEYLDMNADMNNVIYYRLMQTDFDGKFTKSEIISVNSKSEKFDIINSYGYEGNIYINMNSDVNTNALIEVFDISGRVLFSNNVNLQEGINSYKINMPNYASGLYFIRIANEKHEAVVNAKLILK